MLFSTKNSHTCQIVGWSSRLQRSKSFRLRPYLELVTIRPSFWGGPKVFPLLTGANYGSERQRVRPCLQAVVPLLFLVASPIWVARAPPQPQVVHPYMVGARVTADPKAKPKRKRSQAIVGIAKNVSLNSFPKKPRPKRRRAKRSAASVEANWS